MQYKIYKTPDPHNRLDTSLAYERGIADLLLKFDKGSGLRRIVTSPADNERGFNVVACQLSWCGNAAYVLVPENEQLYLFREASVPAHGFWKRIMKAGLKGLLLGAEEPGIIGQRIRDHDPSYEENHLALCAQGLSQDDWYHFSGRAQDIVAELSKKCAIYLP